MNKALLSRIAAVLVLTIPLNLYMMASERRTLAQLNTDPTSYLAHRKDVSTQLKAVVMFVVMFRMLVVGMLCVEAMAYLFRGDWRQGATGQGLSVLRHE